MLSTIVGLVLKILLVIIILSIIALGYIKAPPDEAYIITGLKKKPRILIGQAGLRIPFLERVDRLLLKQISVDIKTNGCIPTADYIGVDIDAIAKVQIDTSPEGIQIAMKNFLNMSEKDIVNALTDSLQGNMREIIGTIDLKSITSDRKKFGDEVQSKAMMDMKELGIRIISCNIQKVEDENNLIVALGQDNMSQIQKSASIAKAQAERDVAIAQAEAKKSANEAQVEAATQIAQRNNDLEIKNAELKVISDTKKAEADAAYEIQKQMQQKTIDTTAVNAQIAKAEREAELKKQEVEVQQQILDAQVNKKADAEKYRIEQAAAAELTKRQREAEATKYEQEKLAEASKIAADAARYKVEQNALAVKASGIAEAEAIRAKGFAEAEATKAKGEAEAAAMEKKAEAYKKYNSAAMTEMIVKILPDMVKAAAEPISSIKDIKIYSSGDSNGEGVASQVTGMTPTVIKQVFDLVKDTTGVNLSDVMRANTYDAKVNRNVNVNGIETALLTTEASDK